MYKETEIQCTRCGLKFGQITSYSCPSSNCPIFVQTTLSTSTCTNAKPLSKGDLMKGLEAARELIENSPPPLKELRVGDLAGLKIKTFFPKFVNEKVGALAHLGGIPIILDNKLKLNEWKMYDAEGNLVGEGVL